MKVAFVFAGGRSGMPGEGPSDFLYGARELSGKPGWEVRCLSVDDLPADKLTGFLAGRLFRRLVPPRTSADWLARTRRIVPRLAGFDVIVATATELSFGLAFWKAAGLLRPPLVGLMLGAVTHPMPNRLRRRISSTLAGKMSIALFSGSEEREISVRFGIAPGRITDCSFGVDESFWTPPPPEAIRSGVLAVGSDGRRDHELLVKAACRRPEQHFEILSRVAPPSGLPQNVTWKSGENGKPPCKLEELLPKYHSAACVVIPLKESLQPSGQSVAMQAMMCGAPVVTTKTSGWWGGDVIRDPETVRLVAPGDAVELAAAIGSSCSGGSVLDARDALLQAKWTAGGFADRLGAVIGQSASEKR